MDYEYNKKVTKDDFLTVNGENLTWDNMKNKLANMQLKIHGQESSNTNLKKIETEKLNEAFEKYQIKKPISSDDPLTIEDFMAIIRIAQEEEAFDFEHKPQGPGIMFIKDILTEARTGREPKKKNASLNKLELKTGDITFEYDSKKARYTGAIQKDLYENLARRQNPNTRKMFNFLLVKANEQNFNDTINFNLQELVDRGMYSNIRSAYRGAKTTIDNLRSIELEGVQYQGKKEVRNARTYIFISRDISRKGCIVKVAPGFLENMCLYFSLFPKNWAYTLTNKAFTLLDYIYTMARQQQNVKKITEKGFFNISLKAVNEELGQPDPNETQKHKQYITEPIEKAIEEIEEKRKTDIKITPIFEKEPTNARDFLKGYLEIILDSQSIDYFKKMYNARTKKIKEAAKKKSSRK